MGESSHQKQAGEERKHNGLGRWMLEGLELEKSSASGATSWSPFHQQRPQSPEQQGGPCSGARSPTVVGSWGWWEPGSSGILYPHMVVCSHCGEKNRSKDGRGHGQDGWGSREWGWVPEDPFHVPGSDSSEYSQYSRGPWIESMLFWKGGKGRGLGAESVVGKTHFPRGRMKGRKKLFLAASQETLCQERD